MTAIGITEDAGQDRPSALVITVRVAIVLVAIAALLSPLYVALRGSSFLNQPPPALWGVNAGTGTSGTGGASQVGTTPGSTQKTSGLGGC